MPNGHRLNKHPHGVECSHAESGNRARERRPLDRGGARPTRRLAYGATRDEAGARVKVLALRVIADRFENGEPLPRELAGVFEAA